MELWTQKGKVKMNLEVHSFWHIPVTLPYIIGVLSHFKKILLKKKKKKKRVLKFKTISTALKKTKCLRSPVWSALIMKCCPIRSRTSTPSSVNPGSLDLIMVFHIPTLFLPWQRHPGLAVIAFAVWVSVSGLCASGWLTARFLMLLQCASCRNG